jgi:hypothetical protein
VFLTEILAAVDEERETTQARAETFKSHMEYYELLALLLLRRRGSPKAFTQHCLLEVVHKRVRAVGCGLLLRRWRWWGVGVWVVGVVAALAGGGVYGCVSVRVRVWVGACVF